jgi:YggT family protein
LNHQIAQVFSAFLYLLIFAIIARSLLSWFPVSPTNQYVRLLNRFTEPLLEPVRRIMPRTGMIDLSAMVVIILLYVMLSVVGRAASS